MTSYVSRSLRGDEIYYKWLPWTCLRRLALISREVSQYQYDEVSDTFLIEEDLFRTGMAMEAVSPKVQMSSLWLITTGLDCTCSWLGCDAAYPH